MAGDGEESEVSFGDDENKIMAYKNLSWALLTERWRKRRA